MVSYECSVTVLYMGSVVFGLLYAQGLETLISDFFLGQCDLICCMVPNNFNAQNPASLLIQIHSLSFKFPYNFIYPFILWLLENK